MCVCRVGLFFSFVLGFFLLFCKGFLNGTQNKIMGKGWDVTWNIKHHTHTRTFCQSKYGRGPYQIVHLLLHLAVPLALTVYGGEETKMSVKKGEQI